MAQLKNYVEEIVKQQVNEVTKDVDMCKCEKCILDVVALALNDLHPKYIVSEKGELYSKINAFGSQSEVDIIFAVTKAANIVKSRPRHD